MQADYAESVYAETENNTLDVGTDQGSDVGLDQESDVGSESGCTYLSIEHALETLANYFEEFCEEVDTVHSTIQTMEKPVTSVALATFSQPRTLESAMFRKQRFGLKEPAKNLLGCKSTDLTFGALCHHIRTYLFTNNLVDSTGRIQLNADLKTLLETEESSVSFLWILKHLQCFVE